jgi:hypothetical protein
MATRIQFWCPDEFYFRIKKHPTFPKSQSGKAHSKFWLHKFLDGSINSPRFQFEELQAELAKERAARKNAEFLLELERKKNQTAA